MTKNWPDLPPDVQSPCKEFGTFYCNFAGEVKKTFKSYDAIAIGGKNVHTFSHCSSMGDKACTDCKQSLSPTWVQQVTCRRQFFVVVKKVGPISCLNVLLLQLFSISSTSSLSWKACQHSMLYSNLRWQQLKEDMSPSY